MRGAHGARCGPPDSARVKDVGVEPLKAKTDPDDETRVDQGRRGGPGARLERLAGGFETGKVTQGNLFLTDQPNDRILVEHGGRSPTFLQTRPRRFFTWDPKGPHLIARCR